MTVGLKRSRSWDRHSCLSPAPQTTNGERQAANNGGSLRKDLYRSRAARRGKRKTLRAKVLGGSLGNSTKLFSSFLRGASCPKSPRVAATAAISFMPKRRPKVNSIRTIVVDQFASSLSLVPNATFAA